MKFSAQRWSDAVRCDLAVECLRTSGRLRLKAFGWSMLPSLWPGDALMIERTSREGVSLGDIVLFRREDRFFVHRLVSKCASDSNLVTRGDALPHSDLPITDRELLGKVISLERNGKRIEVTQDLPLFSRAVAALLQRSEFAVRAVAHARGILRSSTKTLDPRDTSCQN
jgi:hypothetical protein